MENVNVGARKVYERIMRTCVSCNKPFSIPPAEQKFYEEKGMELPKRCSECRIKRGKRVKFVCVDCGKEFFLFETNIKFYKDHGLELPKRCKNCLEDKKMIRERNEAIRAQCEAKAKAEEEADGELFPEE